MLHFKFSIGILPGLENIATKTWQMIFILDIGKIDVSKGSQSESSANLGQTTSVEKNLNKKTTKIHTI